MNSYNNITLIGNVGGQPECRGKTRAEKIIVTFALAQSILGVDSSTQERLKKDSQWFQISCFAGLAERVLSTLSKGDLAMVSGELKSKSYLNGAGEKRISFEIVAQEVFRVERLRKFQKGDFMEPSVKDSCPTFEEWKMEGVTS